MSRFEDALRFAVEVHSGMTRRTEGIPYVLHPMEVATIAASMTSNDDVLCAALLHDVVEDTPTTMDEVRERFGERVAQLVASETEDKRPELPAAQTWQVRKEESLEELAAATDDGVLVLWLADKLSNMRSFARMYRHEGDKVWSHFNQNDPEAHHWYYRSVADMTRQLSASDAWGEYDALVKSVFNEE
jgi:(p)ppGpp synthase/HD superfamily hydrolase